MSGKVWRGIIFWLLLAAFAAVSVWWTLIIPHRPEDLFRAIPGHATAVSRHDGLATRWDTIAAHPLPGILAGVLGGDPEDWENVKHDPGFRAVVDLVGQRELALAYVPYMDGHDRGAWVLAAWIGGQSQRLRWFHRQLGIPDLTYIGDMAGWPVWTWSWEAPNGRRTLTLSLVEGMLIGSAAADPGAIRLLLDAYNGNFPSLATRTDLAAGRSRLHEDPRPDRAWIIPPAAPESRRWLIGLNLPATNSIQLSATTGGLTGLRPLPATIATEALQELWHAAPIATAAGSGPTVTGFLADLPATIPARLVVDVVTTLAPDAVVLGLFGGDYSGRMRGIRIPALMAALHNAALPSPPEEIIASLLDRWNARYRMGLVAAEQTIGPYRLWRIEGIADGFYAALAAPDQMAIAVAGPWVIISSNYRALETVIRRRTGGLDDPSWATALRASLTGQATGHLEFDLIPGADAFRQAINAYSLKLLFEDPAGTRRQREQLNDAKGWLDAVVLFERLHITVTDTQEGEVVLDVHAGP